MKGDIKPGHPQQSGRHERMHLTLKKDLGLFDKLLNVNDVRSATQVNTPTRTSTYRDVTTATRLQASAAQFWTDALGC